jgi:hypothetical protein
MGFCTNPKSVAIPERLVDYEPLAINLELAELVVAEDLESTLLANNLDTGNGPYHATGAVTS